MKIIFMILLMMHSFDAAAQLDWRNSTPSYPDGDLDGHTYQNVGSSPPVNVSVALAGGGTLTWQANYPRVFTTAPSRLGLGVNHTSNDPSTSLVSVTLVFSEPVCGLNFNLFEIDRGDLFAGAGGGFQYVDQVVISATDQSGTTLADPLITPSQFASVTGNTITGTSSDVTVGGGASTGVSFAAGTCVKTLTITYRSTSDARLNPTNQLVSIGNMNWGTVLPVTLVSFGVRKSAEGNTLNWQTTSESESSRFSIEKSSDSRSFRSIGTVTAAGQSNTILNYAFTDTAPSEGHNYYRLKMIDRDETFSYSRVISIKNSGDIYCKIQPVHNEFIVETNASQPGFWIYNSHGSLIPFETESSGTPGSYRLKPKIGLPNDPMVLIFKIVSTKKTFTYKLLRRPD